MVYIFPINSCIASWKDPGHAVRLRAGQLDDEYRRKLHDVDRAAGTQCPHRILPGGSCARSDNDQPHGVGGGERHYLDTFGRVRALVFGHFCEFNGRGPPMVAMCGNHWWGRATTAPRFYAAVE